MKKTMIIIATISAIGISGLAQAAQESRPGQERMKSAYDAAVKKCAGKKGDQREDCLKEAQEKKGAPAKTDVRKQDRIQPEPMKSDMKK